MASRALSAAPAYLAALALLLLLFPSADRADAAPATAVAPSAAASSSPLPSPSSLLAATLSASEPAPPGADAAASPASDLQVLATAQAVYEQQQAERYDVRSSHTAYRFLKSETTGWMKRSINRMSSVTISAVPSIR